LLILLKLASFAIWFVIMLFIIGAASQRKKSPIEGWGSYLYHEGENRSKFRGHEKI